MSSAWSVSSISEDSNDLPSFSHVLSSSSQQKSEQVVLSSDDDENCYTTLSARLNKGSSHIPSTNVVIVEDIQPPESTEISNALSAQSNLREAVNTCSSSIVSKKTGTVSNLQKKEEARKRKAAQVELKNLKPEECLKNMVCMIERSVDAMFDGTSLIALLPENSDSSFKIVDSTHPIVRWERKVVSYAEGVEQQPQVHDEPDIFVVLHANDLVTFIDNESNGCNAGVTSLTEWLCRLKEDCRNTNIRVVCVGLQKYKKQVHNKILKEYKKSVFAARDTDVSSTQRKSKKSKIPDLKPEEIEDTLVELQLSHGVNILQVEKKEEFLELIQQITKSIGEAPYKRMKRQNIQFINESSSVKVNATTGEGSRKAWRQILGQFHSVSPEMASAIISKYPTLSKLMEAYEKFPNDAESLLSDIIIRRGVGTLENHRRLGPQLSKRIHKMFTSIDGEEILY